MSNARDIIVRPLVTEKTLKSQENNNTVVFEVKKGTNKIQIRQAIEEIYNVKVEAINIVNVKPRAKRMGKYNGFTKAVKKAYVMLKEGSTITILGDK